jgi:hypothetical protein
MFRATSRLMLLALAALAVPAAFSQAVSFSKSDVPNYSLYHADFNSDGREDFILTAYASANCPSSDFALVLSTGDGAYAPPVCYALPSGSADYIAIGDFNNDGSPDLIVGNGTKTIYEYLGSPSGTLHLHATLVAAVEVEGIVAADVNHDGKIDLLFVGSDYNLHVWFGKGDGTFTPGPDTPMAVPGGLSIGDFDGDGNADVVSQANGEGGNAIQVFYGDGKGHFTAMPYFNDDTVYATYDLNGDGRMDLVGNPFDFSINGSKYYKIVKVRYGNANRTFTTRRIKLGNCSLGWPPAIADFNGDGINDIAVVEGSDCQGDGPDTFNVMLGNGDGTYQPEQVIYTGTTSAELLYATFPLRGNRDSKADLLLFEEDPSGGTSFLFLNTTTGNFPACSPLDSFTGITLCSPTTTVVPSSPVKFSIGAANQTPGRDVQVWIDGKKVGENLKGAFSYYTFLDASFNLSAGKHSVTVYSAGWDNLLESFTFPLTVGSTTCVPPDSPGVNVCRPLNKSTVDSSVLAWAAGTVTGKIARMDVWVDGVKKYSIHGSNTLKTNLSLDSGTHKFTYDIVNTDGKKWMRTVYATVQ